MTLEQLINWLKEQDPRMIVEHGFSEPHSDRGNYYNLAFDPEPTSTIRDMLKYAKSAIGQVFPGWKGGEYKMELYTDVYIGVHGHCGIPITKYTLLYWQLTGELKEIED